MFALLIRLEAGLEFLVRVTAVVFLGLVFVFTLGSATDRYIYNTPFNAHDQIAQLGLVWVTFLGFALAIRARTNIRVDLVDGLLSARWLQARNVLSDVIALGIFGVIQWKIWRLVEVGAGQVIMGTPFSSDAMFLALAVGSAVAIVAIAVRLALLFARRSMPDEGASC